MRTPPNTSVLELQIEQLGTELEELGLCPPKGWFRRLWWHLRALCGFGPGARRRRR